MSALRLILLVAGLIFIAALIAWESRRGRGRGGEAGGEPRPAERGLSGLHPPRLDVQRSGTRTEPTLGDTDAVATDDIAGEAPAGLMPPPDADTLADLRVDDDLRVTEPLPAAADLPAAAQHDTGLHGVEPYPGRGEPQTAAARNEATPWHAQPGEGVALSEVVVHESPLSPPELPPSPPLIVEWPLEAERRIVGVRLMPCHAERFAGRALRQALAAAGFVHGRFGIYHLPAADGRAVVSAASLSRPGILDPDSMDFQRFAGLSLFIVLPGALTPEASFESLLRVAEQLAERMDGQLQDERGGRLDAARAAQLREELLRAPAPSVCSVKPGPPVSPMPPPDEASGAAGVASIPPVAATPADLSDRESHA